MLNFVVISYNNTYSYLKTNICLNWKYVLSFQAAPNLNKNIFSVNKGVTMRAIFSNPAGWKFIDSNGWKKKKFWRKQKFSAKIASGQALFPPLVKAKNQHQNY